MDRKPSFQRKPLWTLTFDDDDVSQKAPSILALKMAFDESSNRRSKDESPPDEDDLDNNFFDETAANPVEEQGDDTSNYASRVHSIHRNRKYNGPSNIEESVEARMGDVNGRTLGKNIPTANMAESIEYHANLIVARMERDAALMEDSPTSEELRKEALRDMPQSLTLKRQVKVKLSKSVSQKSKHKPLSYYKMFKYRTSITMSKFKLQMKNLAYSFELWYGTVKQIEGNFGSGVASFFKFLRWMFVLDLFIALLTIAFVVVPQLTFEPYNVIPVDGFDWRDIFSGEGYLTNTFFYYGFYSNQTRGPTALKYSMPDAYFFTMVCLYLSAFAVFSISVARSYRRSFIETEGGLKNVYAHKIFCGWDYNIATEDAAQLKSRAIYNELKELLFEAMHQSKKDSCMEIFWVKTMQICMNMLIFLSLVGVGYLMWFLMDKSALEHWPSIYTAITVNIIMTLFPIIFSAIIHYEGYKSPKTKLYFTLIRTFILGFVIIGVLVTFWLKNPDNECWETSLGQEVYRLILFDFLFSVIITPTIDLICYQFCRLFNKGHLHFDIARHTMQIIYNQTLFWVGFFFSPFLAILVVVKLFLMWYVRKFIVLKFCKPSSKSWRAAQTTTWFLMMAFLSLLLVMGLLGYVMSSIPTTNCGPFRGYTYMYEIITLGVFQLRKDNNVWRILLFVTKPGFIALVLIALSGRVYYLRAKAQAQRGIVTIYREMLVWESRDKEFLLQNISKVTKGQWQYKLQEGRELDPIISLQSVPKFGGVGDNIDRELSRFSTPSSSSTEPTSSVSLGSEIESHLYSKYKKYS